MRELLVAVFDTPTKTDRAIEALHASGVSDTAIRRYHKDDPAIPYGARHTTTTTTEVAPQTRPHESSGGFWSWLLGEEGATTDQDYERDHGIYGRAVESGSTVIAVTVEQTDVRRIMDVLADHVPDELQDAGAVEPRTHETAPLGTETTRMQDTAAVGTAHAAPLTQHERASEEHVQQSRAGESEEVIPLAEEDVSISKRQVDRGTTRIRRYVVATPVERQVNLREEHVEIERRKPIGTSTVGEGAFEERTVEVRDTTEEPVVSKTARVAEEVVVHRDVTETPTTVHETVRREGVEVTPDNNARATVTDHTTTPTAKTPTPSDKPHT